MKIVFLSNFYNHHQAFLSKKLYELTSGQYKFIEVEKMPNERMNLGYSNKKDEYVVYYYDSCEDAQGWIDNADVLIVGSVAEKFFKRRKDNNKLIIKYSERPLKKGLELWKYPIRWIRWHRNSPPNKLIYMLCASGYTAADYAKFGMYKNKTYKWGYFPECKKYEDLSSLMRNKKRDEILWCGRVLDWKHPDDVLTVAEYLKRDGYQFHVSIIGTGEMQDYLQKRIIKNEMQDYVSLLGAMKPEMVRQYMENAGIFLFTSDRKEGWGVVLNESMNSGCAVVASHEIGSVPYLMKDNENGLVYESQNIKMLYEKVKYLLDFKDEQKRLGEAAYYTIVTEWNYEIAAERLVELVNQISSDNSGCDLYNSGPCSRA